MDELAVKRAQMAGDSRVWTPKDALEFVQKELEGVDPKRVQMAIYFFVENDAGERDHHYALVNISRSEQIAMLEFSKYRALEDWRA